jgi:hypothetical protein
MLRALIVDGRRPAVLVRMTIEVANMAEHPEQAIILSSVSPEASWLLAAGA